MPHQAIGFGPDPPHGESESAGRYDGEMTDLHVHIPDEVAQRLATEAAQRGTSTEDVAAEVLTLHAPARTGDGLGFIALAHAKPGFSARAAEELLEAEGFV
jgi:plasmid stability protein